MSSSPPPTRDEPDYLDADMRPSDIIDILKHLKFANGKAVVQVDRPARDYLVTSVAARVGK
jgi:hypothetical protein